MREPEPAPTIELPELPEVPELPELPDLPEEPELFDDSETTLEDPLEVE